MKQTPVKDVERSKDCPRSLEDVPNANKAQDEAYANAGGASASSTYWKKKQFSKAKSARDSSSQLDLSSEEEFGEVGFQPRHSPPPTTSSTLRGQDSMDPPPSTHDIRSLASSSTHPGRGRGMSSSTFLRNPGPAPVLLPHPVRQRD